MRRIHVTGNAGVGKTTTAARLGRSLGLPVYSLDAIVWQSRWKKTPAEERLAREAALIAEPRWVIDGVSQTVREAADTIVFLDLPRGVCLYRCARRNWRYLFRSRPGLPEQCPEYRIAPYLARLIWRFPRRVRPAILDESKGKIFVHVRSARDLDRFLDGLTSEPVERAG